MIKQKIIPGFSLTELMIVIAIIMVLASLIGFNIHFFNNARIHSELNLLHAACSYLQQKAIASNMTQELIFDATHNTYSVQGQIHSLPAALRFALIPNVKGPPSSPTLVVKEPITFANHTITFYPDGIISAGTVYITDSQVLYALSSGIAHVSYLRKYRYDGVWHLL